MRFLKLVLELILLVLLLVVAGLFFMENNAVLTAPLELYLTFFSVQFLGYGIPTYAIFIGAFVLGSLLSLFFLTFDKIRSSRELKVCRRRLACLEQEVTSLRNLPLQEQGFGQGSPGSPASSGTAGASPATGSDSEAK